MAEIELPQPIAERLERVQSLEQRILKQTADLMERDPTRPKVSGQLDAVRSLATRHIRAIGDLALRRHIETSISDDTRGARTPSLFPVDELVETVSSVISAYGVLYAAGRLLYEPEVADDVAYPHGEEWRDQLSAMADLLVTDVHSQVLAEGFTCRCVCPACGMGACLCTRNSIETVRELWARPEPEPLDGIELRITPRPGSELARVGMSQGDRIMLVDGELVRTNGDLQSALRKHDTGEPIPIQVERSGRLEEIRAARVSDLP